MGNLIKIKSDNLAAHPKGYYIQFKDRQRPDEIEYVEPVVGSVVTSEETNPAPQQDQVSKPEKKSKKAAPVIDETTKPKRKVMK